MSTKNGKRVLVGLSGGVDSAVSAFLLQEAGYDVVAGFMKNYTSDDEKNCTTREDRDVALKVAEHLGIKTFSIFDFREEYEERIIRYIYDGYARGVTPNPDVFCNNLVKFDLFAERARELGFDAIATGHYARVIEQGGRHELHKGLDPTKDQSYFLSELSEAQLSYAMFPIGHLRKSEVRDIARRAGLPNAERPDSQGLCFIGKVPMKEFLRKRLDANPGPIVDTSGKAVGTHDGLDGYTIGQRKGIGIGGREALFVVEKNIATNTLVVGPEDDPRLLSTKCHVANWRWINDPLPRPSRVGMKIRYRQPDQQALLSICGGAGDIIFSQAQRAVTPGQIAVAYDCDRVAGAGEIVAEAVACGRT